MESIVIDRRITKWKNLKQRLGLKAMGCCGASWSPKARISILEEDEEGEEEVIIRRGGNVVNNRIQNQTENSASTPLLVGQQQQQQQVVPTTGSGMNLAMALEAERNLRATNVGPSATGVKTLMRLIEETEGVDWNKKKRKDVVVNNVEGVGVVRGGSCDWMCCVCMERKKGAAFIPCGHTFCRVCSREVWVNRRGSCPVCNRSILDILDLF
ncbi:hypothetical protein CRYUN_Cryun01aG0123200 [Craigia yunnanensis]